MGGTYLLLPSHHTPLPSTFQILEGKFRFQVRHAPKRLHTQNTHTHTLSLEDVAEQEGGWARAQVRAWRASLLALSRGSGHTCGNTQTRAHICFRG